MLRSISTAFLAMAAFSCALPEGNGAEAQLGSTNDIALIGAQGAGDFSDTSCQIVLRDFGRVTAESGYVQNGSRWIFAGRVDVAHTALAEGAVPRLLVKAGSDPAWRALEPLASTSISDTHERFLFQIEDGDLPGPGISTTALMRAKVEVVPFLSLDQTRLFDHNRNPDPFATYAMQQVNGFSVAEDSAVCGEADGPTLTFDAAFQTQATGPVVGGRSVHVAYDAARLPSCRARYAGRPAWNIQASALFLPMNVRQDVGLLDVTSESIQTAHFFAPEGATEMQLWFLNTDRTGCSAYDSNFGANYRFPVVEQAPAWVGNESVVISRAASARCEGAVPLVGAPLFDSWARQRATITDVCFDVYAPGTTDRDNPNLWRELDVQVHHRFDAALPFQTHYVSFAHREGNNARYAIDLRAFDPFQWGRCLDGVPLTPVNTGPEPHVQASLEMYVTVNGARFPAAADAFLYVTYDDAASSPHVACE